MDTQNPNPPGTLKRKRGKRGGLPFVPIWQKAFLEGLARTGIVSFSCRAAGIDRSTAYERRQINPAFAKLWKEAEDEAADNLEMIAVQRASKQEAPSDLLLIFLLKARRPEKFRERFTAELTEKDGAPLLSEFSASLERVYGASKPTTPGQ